MSATPARTGHAWGWFAAWVAVGAAYLLSLLAAASVGLFLAPLPVIATVVLATRRGALRGLPGALSGAGLPVLYIAYLNRSGPGTICTTIQGGQFCSERWDPWPWLAVGLFAVVAGAVVFLAVGTRRRVRPAPEGSAQ